MILCNRLLRLAVNREKVLYNKKSMENYSAVTSLKPPFEIKKEREQFLSSLPRIVDFVVNDHRLVNQPDLQNWVKKLTNHTLIGGKYARGLTTVMAYQMLEKPEDITKDSMEKARSLGWCIELLQAYMVTLDDIMDQSTTRRGRVCWYLLPDVGIGSAINDAVILQSIMFLILRSNFVTTPNYIKMVDKLTEVILHCSVGQHLDLKTGNPKERDYNSFTMERYLFIIQNKSAYYTYNLPISMGIFMSNCGVDGKAYDLVQDICLDIGTMFQIQDDFIDCFGDEKITGKAGTDIREGKCTWLAVTALQRCSNPQRIVFKACYGSVEPAHIERVKRLYEELCLPEIYRQQERETYERILDKIENLPTEDLKRLMTNTLENTYKRIK